MENITPISKLFDASAQLQTSSKIFHKKWMFIKRSVDLCLALIFLILLLPFIIIIALIIILDSHGNPFFIQTRIGNRGCSFGIFKFRTLHLKNFGFFHEDEIYYNDPRVTRFGKYLRRYKVDELPQLINIILGQMSFVGPRPDIPEQVVNYSPGQFQRLTVKPGLTGIAQVSGNTSLPWKERIVLDKWYVDNWYPMLDCKIIFITAIAILKGESSSDLLGVHKKLLKK